MHDHPERLESWQRVIDLMAQLLSVPAAAITKITGENLDMLVTSRSDGNPYRAGMGGVLEGSESYCEAVIETRERLLVRDATKDPAWRSRPSAEMGLISYLGYPILFPNGDVFGTICVFDAKANGYSPAYETLIQEFKGLVEAQLELMQVSQELEERNDELNRSLQEIRTLREITPICSFCKKIRADDGYWEGVERYLTSMSGGQLSHGICPDCLQDHYGELFEHGEQGEAAPSRGAEWAADLPPTGSAGSA